MLREVGCETNDTFRLQRLGKISSNHSRPIRISGLNDTHRSDILRRSKSLRLIKRFNKVYINADLTPLQQRESKSLREELSRRRAAGEEDLIIFRGKITSRNQNFQ